MANIINHRITFENYKEKVLAGWIGKSLGGIVGAPVEGHKAFGDFKDSSSFPHTIFPNDDLDIQVVWLEMMEEIGVEPGINDMAKYWKERCWYNFCEYGIFLNNYDRGINPPLSGSFNNSYYHHSMGSPIRAEIWGMVCPGMPEQSVKLAALDAKLDHEGFSVYAEEFWAACISLAFFENDLTTVLEKAFGYISDKTELYSIYLNSKKWEAEFKNNELDLLALWRKIVRTYGNKDGSKAAINFAFTITALNISEGNFVNTINTCLNFGWDTDCTAATAGALLGVLYGTGIMPLEWCDKMGKNLTCDVNVRHKTASLESFAFDTCVLGVEKTGGSILCDIPISAEEHLRELKSKRGLPECLEFSVNYPCGPGLLKGEAVEAELIITNKSTETVSFKYTIKGEEHIIAEGELIGGITLEAGKKALVEVSVKQAELDKIYDKNLLFASFEINKKSFASNQQFKFGFVGMRQYNVYGPYWDIYDRDMYDECPYRNDKEYSHPGHKGCYYAQEHGYAYPGIEYLDEKALFIRDLPAENPISFQTPTDYFNLKEISEYYGESTWYFTREIEAVSEKELYLIIGASCEFQVFVDGECVLKNDIIHTYAPRDFSCLIDTSKRRRIVIKALSRGQDLRLGLSFSVLDDIGDKSHGISYNSSDIIDFVISQN